MVATLLLIHSQKMFIIKEIYIDPMQMVRLLVSSTNLMAIGTK